MLTPLSQQEIKAIEDSLKVHSFSQLTSIGQTAVKELKNINEKHKSTISINGNLNDEELIQSRDACEWFIAMVDNELLRRKESN